MDHEQKTPDNQGVWAKKVEEKLSSFERCKCCGRIAVYKMDLCAECFRKQSRARPSSNEHRMSIE